MLPTTTQLSFMLSLRKQMLPKKPARFAQSRRAPGCPQVGSSQPELLGPSPNTHVVSNRSVALKVWWNCESREGEDLDVGCPHVWWTREQKQETPQAPPKTQNTLLGSKWKSRSTSQQLPGKTANVLEFFHQALGFWLPPSLRGLVSSVSGQSLGLWWHGCLLYSREAFVRLLLWPCRWPKVHWGAGARWDNQARQRSPLHTWKVGAHNCLWGNQMASLLCTAVISSVLLQTEWEPQENKVGLYRSL